MRFSSLRLALAAATTVTLAACSGGDAGNAGASASATPAVQSGAASSSGSADGDLGDITSYRLTMDKLDKYFAAQRNMALKAKAMSPAEREALKNSSSSDADASLDDMVRNIESTKPMNDAIREAGLSAREFSLLTMSMLQSGMAAAVLKMRPNDNQDSLAREMKANLENIKFFQEHEAELTQKQKALQAEMKAMGLNENDEQ